MKKSSTTFTVSMSKRSRLCIFFQVRNWNELLRVDQSAFMFMPHKNKIKNKRDDKTKEPINPNIHCRLQKRHYWLLLSFLHLPLLRFSRYAPQGPEPPPTHLAALCAPHNCSPRSALTWEDWLQAVACSSREQAWRRALGGNNFNLDPPLPRPQHELRTGFREREEKHRVN